MPAYGGAFPYYPNTMYGPPLPQPKAESHTIEYLPKKRFFRGAAGDLWEDPTLSEWPEGDFRIFVGDLGNEVTDEILRQAFSKYESLAKAKVIRDKRTFKTKGYGFVSFLDPHDFVRALRDMNGKYIGNRPCKLRKSRWEDRTEKGSKRKIEKILKHKKKGRKGGKPNAAKR